MTFVPQLADLPAPAPGSTENFLWILGALLTLAALAWSFRRKTPIEAEFVTKAEFQTFKAEVNADLRRIFDKMEENKTTILAAGERRKDVLEGRLTELAQQVARLDERSHRNP